MVVYIDELFLLNLIINYLLLLSCAMLCGTHIRRFRIFLGAAIGAVYACCIFFPEFQLFYSFAIKALFSIIMSLTAYGYGDFRSFLRRSVVFYLISFAFAGAMLALFKFTNPENFTVRNGIFYTGIPSGILIVVSLAAYLILTLLLRGTPQLSQHPPPKTVLAITVFGKTLTIEAMVDTGNRLSDPMTNARIVVAEYRRVRELFPPGIRNILDIIGVADAAQTLRMLANAGYCEGFRLVPYSAIGLRHGLLLAFRPERIEETENLIDGALLALTANNLSEETGCSAVIGA